MSQTNSNYARALDHLTRYRPGGFGAMVVEPHMGWGYYIVKDVHDILVGVDLGHLTRYRPNGVGTMNVEPVEGQGYYFVNDVQEAVAQAVGEGMPVGQEPKYGILGNRIYNRASGEFIPADEPVFIFRARDVEACKALEHYMSLFGPGDHRAAIDGRLNDFRAFAAAHPERMKIPDTARDPERAATGDGSGLAQGSAAEPAAVQAGVPSSTPADQARFEAAWRAKYNMPATVPFSKFEDGRYQALSISDTYEGWQMALAAQGEGVVAVIRSLPVALNEFRHNNVTHTHYKPDYAGSASLISKGYKPEPLVYLKHVLAVLGAPSAVYPDADRAQADDFRGPLTDAQRNEIRAYAATMHGGLIGKFDDIIVKASVAGYMNGRHDFAPPAAPAEHADGFQGAVDCPECGFGTAHNPGCALDPAPQAEGEQAEKAHYEYQPRHENGMLLDWTPLQHAETEEEARAYCVPRGFEWRRAAEPGATAPNDA